MLFVEGQDCAASSRAFVHEGIYDRFLAEVVNIFEEVKWHC